MKSEYRKKQEAKERAAQSLQQTKKRLGVGLQGRYVAQSRARLPPERGRGDRSSLPPPTGSPGQAFAGDFMHAPQWKRGAHETEATVREIGRKASKIAPAYNKGALQYLPDD